jgi:hypothetical protein
MGRANVALLHSHLIAVVVRRFENATNRKYWGIRSGARRPTHFGQDLPVRDNLLSRIGTWPRKNRCKNEQLKTQSDGCSRYILLCSCFCFRADFCMHRMTPHGTIFHDFIAIEMLHRQKNFSRKQHCKY